MGDDMFEKRPAVWNRIVAKAWADEAFKKKLLADPAAVMREEGMDVREGIRISVVENSARHAWLVLPRQPETESAVAEDSGRVADLGLGFFHAVRAM
jgi:hypothetical protein